MTNMRPKVLCPFHGHIESLRVKSIEILSRTRLLLPNPLSPLFSTRPPKIQTARVQLTSGMRRSYRGRFQVQTRKYLPRLIYIKCARICMYHFFPETRHLHRLPSDFLYYLLWKEFSKNLRHVAFFEISIKF